MTSGLRETTGGFIEEHYFRIGPRATMGIAGIPQVEKLKM